MEKEYRIKGIKKILEKVSKEDLARYFGVDENADFEKILTEDLKKLGIPNDAEVALYIALTPQEELKIMQKDTGALPGKDIIAEFMENDERERAMYGIYYELVPNEYGDNGRLKKHGTYVNKLYFAVDEPIKESVLEKIKTPLRYFVGGVHYSGLLMGKKYFEEHEEELSEIFPKRDKIQAVESYIENFMNEFKDVESTGGYGPRQKYEGTDEIREEKRKNEQIILELTGKSSIDELSLRDFIQLKRRLEQEEKDLRKAFEDKFTKKDEETKE